MAGWLFRVLLFAGLGVVLLSGILLGASLKRPIVGDAVMPRASRDAKLSQLERRIEKLEKERKQAEIPQQIEGGQKKKAIHRPAGKIFFCFFLVLFFTFLQKVDERLVKKESLKSDVISGAKTDAKQTQQTKQIGSRRKIGVLVLAFDRAEYLKRTLSSVLKYLDISRFELFVSQDGNDQVVENLIRKTSGATFFQRYPRFFVVVVLWRGIISILNFSFFPPKKFNSNGSIQGVLLFE
jgi:hypothetical protein